MYSNMLSGQYYGWCLLGQLDPEGPVLSRDNIYFVTDYIVSFVECDPVVMIFIVFFSKALYCFPFLFMVGIEIFLIESGLFENM